MHKRLALIAICLLLLESPMLFGQVAPNARKAGQPPAAEEAFLGLGALCCVGTLSVALIGLYVWSFVFVIRDTKRRGMDSTPWIIALVLIGLLGLLIYLCVREPLLDDDYDDYYVRDDRRPRRRRRSRPHDDDEDIDEDDDRYERVGTAGTINQGRYKILG